MAKKGYLAKKTDNGTAYEEENKKNLETLMSRLGSAQRYEEKQKKQWKAVLDVLDFKREVMVGTDSVSTKIKYPLLWSAYDNYLSELTSTPPQILIDAEGREDNVKKIFWRGILEYTKRKIRVDDHREQFIQSFLVTGKAVYKVGRAIESKQVEQVQETMPGMPPIKQKVDVITRNESFVSVLDPRKVWISPETIYQGPVLGEECPYVIEEMVKTPEYIEAMYEVTVDEDEKETISPEEDMTEGGKYISHSDNYQSSDSKRVRLYSYQGIWEVNGKSVKNAEVLFTKKRIVKERELPYSHGKKTYIYALNFKKFFKPCARGALDAVMDLDQEYNEHMNRVRTILRRLANPKWEKLKGSQVDESALLDPDVGVIVEVSQFGAVKAIDMPRIDPSLIDKATSVEQLFQLITGIVYGSSAIKEAGTATGQDIVAKGADIKIGRMSRIIERAEEERDIMLLQLEQQYAGEDGIDIRITGSDVIEMIKQKKMLQSMAVQNWMSMGGEQSGMPAPIDEYEQFQLSDDGRSVYTTYTKEDIQGEFELTVVSQSSNRSNRAVRSQQTLNALEKSANDPAVNRPELWRRAFTLMGESNVEVLVNGMGSPVAQQPPAQSTGAGVRTPTNGALQGSVTSQANKTV